MVRFLAAHLLLAHSRAACLRPLSRVELAIAHRKICLAFGELVPFVFYEG